MRLQDWTGPFRPPVVAGDGIEPPIEERRSEPRHDCCGLKVIIRQRRALGIIHLSNLSTWGACGLTDMPVAVGSLVFLELKKGHFYGARVKWVLRMTIGVQLVRQMRTETMARLLARARRRSAH